MVANIQSNETGCMRTSRVGCRWGNARAGRNLTHHPNFLPELKGYGAAVSLTWLFHSLPFQVRTLRSRH